MGLFDFLKKQKITKRFTSENGVLGPTFLDGLTEPIQNPKDLLSHEWRRTLRSPSGQTQFRIKFYGKLHEKYKNLIVGTDFAPSLIIAVDISSGQEILLFDGCKHGYNAMFCENFSFEQINNRPTSQNYVDTSENDTFEIILSTYNGIDFDEEFADEVDENGYIELVDGTKIELEKAKRNSFDTLQIWAVHKNGETIDLVSEELA